MELCSPLWPASPSNSVMRLDYDIPAVAPYINWEYFYHAWGLHGQPAEDRQQLRQEADDMLARLAGHYRTHALFRLFPAYSDGDDIVCRVTDEKCGVRSDECGVRSVRIPFLRQQQADSDFLCLADFISPDESPRDERLEIRDERYDYSHGVQGNHISHFSSLTSHLEPPLSSHLETPLSSQLDPASTLGLFAATVDLGLETDFANDVYQQMMVQLLADRLAEATAERMHQEVRTRYWGYAPDEQLSIEQLHRESFQGIRPAVGYPSLPDTSLHFIIDSLIGLRQVGIRLSEHGAMKPHASVCGFMMAHPCACYFSVGPIGPDQLSDYAARRGLPIAVVRKFLASVYRY